jgi:hypothetical protein
MRTNFVTHEESMNQESRKAGKQEFGTDVEAVDSNE